MVAIIWNVICGVWGCLSISCLAGICLSRVRMLERLSRKSKEGMSISDYKYGRKSLFLLKILSSDSSKRTQRKDLQRVKP